MFGNRQAQTRSRLVGTAVGAVESRKNVRKLHFVNARAVIDNVYQPVSRILAQSDLDGAAFRAVRHCIADNVVESAVKGTLR